MTFVSRMLHEASLLPQQVPDCRVAVMDNPSPEELLELRNDLVLLHNRVGHRGFGEVVAVRDDESPDVVHFCTPPLVWGVVFEEILSIQLARGGEAPIVARQIRNKVGKLALEANETEYRIGPDNLQPTSLGIARFITRNSIGVKGSVSIDIKNEVKTHNNRKEFESLAQKVAQLRSA